MPHILIVEDEPSTSWALAEGLTEDGFTTDTFASGEDAWAWLQSRSSDLVIAALHLPGMSGLELARKLRRGPHAQPVIIMTADGGPEVQSDLARAGVAHWFPKPFAIDALRRSVHQALAAAQGRRRRRARSAVA
ncbi:MAG TPA: response regulator [Candidatus Eisenbacteria bacterium]|jgi:DNA-binding response OmpR family regulator